MTETEKLALAVSLLTASVNQLFDRMDSLQRSVQDLQDIFRGCACFGTQDQTEVP